MVYWSWKSELTVILLLFHLTKHEEIKILDEIPSGKIIADLTIKPVFANDRQQGRSEYKLLSGESFVDYLYIDGSNGKLFTKKRIDRDSLCSEIDLCCKNEKVCKITISVAVMIPRNTDPIIKKVTINIEDRNDHKPFFEPSTFNLSISESCPISSVFQLPVAIDKDSDSYSVKTYKLLKNDELTFSLETQLVDSKTTAYLRLKQKLDREEVAEFKLTILAVDGGSPSLTGTLLVLITITDVNDNSPVFENTRFFVTVNESQMSNDPIIKIAAKDKDINENADVLYKIDLSMSSVGVSDLFRIDIRSGAVFITSPLDYEKQNTYKLVITANNITPGVGTITGTLTVNVININDEKPVIFVDYFKNRQQAQVMEHDPAPKFVSILSVNDKDFGIAGKVICRLENEQELFDLRQSSQDQYKIHTRQPLDREITSKYLLSVICQDQGIPSLSAYVTIPVVVMDANDNKPSISSQTVFHISENKAVGTFVTKVDAFDKDEGLNAQLIYSISDTENRINSYLNIDSQSGIITTAQIIDREATNPPLKKLDFTVTVSDSGSPKLSSMKALQLIIDDENDNQPQFSQTILRFTISENEIPVYRLGQIEITDLDDIGTIHLTISYNKLNYRNCPFSLTTEKNNYWLVSTESLDWEVQSSHELIVIATDGIGYKSHTVSVTIIVIVLDINDNAPLFIFPKPGNKTTQTISYRQQPGFILLTVSATDKDNPDTGNGKFFFSIIEDSHNLFNIDPNEGRIRIHRQMSHSDIGNYFIGVRVEDHGTPSFSSDIRIKIEIKDISFHFNEKGSEYGGFKNERWKFQDSVGNFFIDKEIIFVFGLLLILLIIIVCICFIVYARHVKGWFAFLPDFISLCRHKEELSNVATESINQENNNAHLSPMKYCGSSNYYNQPFISSSQVNLSRSPEIFIKSGKDLYEVLKCTQNMSHYNCEIPIIHEQPYNDMITTTISPEPFQDNYYTLQEFQKDFPKLKDNVPKTISASYMRNNYPINNAAKSNSTSFASSKATYAVSFPNDQSTFV